jgi:hypothetical protein
MNSPAYDIKDMLVAETSLGLVYGTNLFINKEPATPDNTVTLFDYFGGRHALTLDGQTYEYPAIQIRVRNRKQSEAWRIIYGIYTSLHGRAHETWNGSVYEVIYTVGGPALLDWDDNDRCRLIINLNIQRNAG